MSSIEGFGRFSTLSAISFLPQKAKKDAAAIVNAPINFKVNSSAPYYKNIGTTHLDTNLFTGFYCNNVAIKN